MKKRVLVLLATVALLALLMPACIVPAPVPIAVSWVMKVDVSDLIPRVTEAQPGGGDILLRWRNYSSTGDFVGTSVYALRNVRPATALGACLSNTLGPATEV